MFRSALLALLLAAPAAAQKAPDQNAAKRQLFDARGSVVRVGDQTFLTDADRATLAKLPEVAQLQYYGAMAASPVHGLQHASTTGAFNYHSLEAARAAARRGCDGKRGGGARCVVVADVVPRRFREGRGLSLSQTATGIVRGRDYARQGSRIAISPSTGAWGTGTSDAAALQSCGQRDCQIAVRD
ncbi:hypothetical protein [Jannaschia aquimarina]|uniref:5-aminolevulic acid synthase n=1 Tax=Jannaschia aquimarina TaxID=935700 RepID=A0A0D1ECP6_9RHOB|nr:hypothetical protein [Jannaschia aquimarina]KIT14706.1 hypothetical protein jaqu_36480 [Jannaschia aquimarina]SNT38401.1 hypothetical protein SAMN05421775_113136 [Jannaschia aquimarina]